MTAPFTLRAPEWPQDYPALATLLTASSSGWPQTAHDLQHDNESRDPALYQRGWLAVGRLAEGGLAEQAGGALVGAASLGQDRFAPEPWRYAARVDVDPDARGRGVGRALYAELLADLRARGGREANTTLLETDLPGLAFLRRRGWQETWRRHEFWRTVAAGEALPTPELASPELGGLTLRPLDEVMRDDPRHAERLYALDTRLQRDVPSPVPETPRPPEVWAQQELRGPPLRPALSFVLEDPARSGNAQGGPYVGYTTLGFRDGSGGQPGFYLIWMTGVLPEYRGRGLTRALKLASMRALSAVGGGQIRTLNDPPNLAMLHVNRALGFVQQPDWVRYTLTLNTALSPHLSTAPDETQGSPL